MSYPLSYDPMLLSMSVCACVFMYVCVYSILTDLEKVSGHSGV